MLVLMGLVLGLKVVMVGVGGCLAVGVVTRSGLGLGGDDEFSHYWFWVLLLFVLLVRILIDYFIQINGKIKNEM